MTTPLIDGDKAPVTATVPVEEGATDHTLLVWLLRILSALVVPATLVLFFFTLEFLQRDIGKVTQVVIALIVGVLGVWALYWGMDRLVSALPS
ncbi:MAG: hypothetical protein M3P87_02965, partial [Actinomycetota bacterium]|nr:hypothetical protein [Actinomycetota bacterium]